MIINNGSFAYMLGKYGFEFNTKREVWNTYYGADPSAMGVDSKKSPVYLASAGGISVDYDQASWAGIFGYSLSATSLTSSRAYNVITNPNLIYAANYDSQNSGISLRVP